MKTKSLIILLFLIGCFGVDISAQKNIMALVKKCESIDGVDMTFIRKRNKDTKKLEKRITTVNIKSNPTLVNEFISAFKNDESDATEVIESKENGKLSPQLYKFGSIIVTMNIKENGDARVTVINEKVSTDWGG